MAMVVVVADSDAVGFAVEWFVLVANVRAERLLEGTMTMMTLPEVGQLVIELAIEVVEV